MDHAAKNKGDNETLHLSEGDCLAVLADMPEGVFDSIVTDPPYHLASIVKRFGAPGAAEAKEGTDGLFRRSSRGFMGKEWDGGDIAFRPETWAAMLRVAKPGAHLVAFNHSRTFHHMALAIEAAGWEIRDSIFDLYDTGAAWAQFLDSLTADQSKAMHRALAASDSPLLAWLYGSGFPKSHDVAKGIDKLRDDGEQIREVTAWIAAARDKAGIRNADIDAAFGFHGMAGHWTTQGSQPSIPTLDQVPRLLAALGVAESEVPAEIAALFQELNGLKGQPGAGWSQREVVGRETYGRSGDGSWAQHVDGGMFKPGAREVDLTRATDKAAPWEGWGTALKPACEPIILARKPLAEKSVARQTLATGTGGLNIDAARVPSGADKKVTSDSRAAGNGWRAAEGKILPADRFPANVTHDGSAAVRAAFPVDPAGSAARFFYSAKADAEDRAGSRHPTVKPQSLMRWLVRLTTARGGLVLDPFGGSGATAWAAAMEGRRCHLIEREPEYIAHIRARLPEFDPARIAEAEAARAAASTGDQPSLFGGSDDD